MKFNDGYWLLRDGVTARYATEALDVRTEADRCSIAVLTKPVEHRGSHLNTPTITVELSAPAPDVIAVRTSHFVAVGKEVPAFALEPSAAGARVTRDDGVVRLESGRLMAEAAVAGPWELRFAGAGAPLTGSGTRSLGAMSDTARGEFMVERLRLPVGANVYGLGERFTPFVKNGQVLDT
jgi:alpha-D-xyloside xylohydrolase